jgi:hypothetical protein
VDGEALLKRSIRLLLILVPALCSMPALATPQVVQDYLSGTNAGGKTGRFFGFKMPGATLPNNVLVCRFIYSSTTATLTITDDKSNTWSQLVKITDTTSGYTDGWWGTAAATGTQAITPTISALEFNYNARCLEIAFASLTVDQSWGTNNTPITGPTVAAGAKSTSTPGDIIIQDVVNGDGGNGLGFVNVTTSIVVGTGFTLLFPNLELGLGAQYQIQSSAGSINPTMTMNQAAADSFNTVAIALAPSGTGTAPSGMYIASSGTITIPNSVTSPRTEQLPCATGDLLVFEGSTDPVNFDLYHGNTNGTTGWTDSDSNTFTGFLVGGHTASVGQIVAATNATCANPNTRTVSIAFTDGGAPDPIQVYVVRGAATSNTRDTSLGSAAAIGTGGTAGCTTGICWAVVNQSAKAASNTTCANSGTSNTGIQVTPSTANGMLFVAGFTGSGPTCGVGGSSAGVVNMATWFQTEDDACCGLLNSSSIYDFATYSSTAQITNQDNWANSAAAGASGAGYVAVAFKAAAVSATCKATRTLMGAGC